MKKNNVEINKIHDGMYRDCYLLGREESWRMIRTLFNKFSSEDLRLVFKVKTVKELVNKYSYSDIVRIITNEK